MDRRPARRHDELRARVPSRRRIRRARRRRAAVGGRRARAAARCDVGRRCGPRRVGARRARSTAAALGLEAADRASRRGHRVSVPAQGVARTLPAHDGVTRSPRSRICAAPARPHSISRGSPPVCSTATSSSRSRRGTSRRADCSFGRPAASSPTGTAGTSGSPATSWPLPRRCTRRSLASRRHRRCARAERAS